MDVRADWATRIHGLVGYLWEMRGRGRPLLVPISCCHWAESLEHQANSDVYD
jgi:hypothetical protein